MHAIRAIVHGRVQGVFFRAYTRDKANQLNLVGWVRNNRDGTVECHVQGPEEAIVEFIDFLHHGSPSSRVDDWSWKTNTIRICVILRLPTSIDLCCRLFLRGLAKPHTLKESQACRLW